MKASFLRSDVITTWALAVVINLIVSSCAQSPSSTEGETPPLVTSASAAHMVTIPVKGMSCGSCVASVKRSVSSVKGVQAVGVSLEKREATVTYTKGEVSPEQLVKTINELGYQAGKPVDAIRP